MLYLQIYCIKNKHFSNRNVMLYMIIVPHMQVHIDLLKHTHTHKKAKITQVATSFRHAAEVWLQDANMICLPMKQ